MNGTTTGDETIARWRVLHEHVRQGETLSADDAAFYRDTEAVWNAEEDARNARLETRLQERQAELATLESEYATLRAQYEATKGRIAEYERLSAQVRAAESATRTRQERHTTALAL